MGACCSAPLADAPPQAKPFQQSKRSDKKTGVKHFFQAVAKAPSFTYEPLPEGQPKVYRDLLTWELLPDLGTEGVLEIQYLLGAGGSGSTYCCRDLATGQLVAAKFIPRPLTKACIPLMLQEVELQTKLWEGHVGVVPACELLLTPSHLALVMEYAPGGNLAAAVADRWESALTRNGFFFEEQEARFYMRQIVSAVAYLHKQRVAHRDLKLDNTLLMDSTTTSAVRICDFGFAKMWNPASPVMHSSIGTPVYMSPQLISARYSHNGYNGAKADVWAVGVLLYVMLFGCFPFDHDESKDANSEEAYQEVWLGQLKKNWRDLPSVKAVLGREGLSPEATNLLDRLFELDEEKRATMDEVANHAWINLPLPEDKEAAWQQLQQEQKVLEESNAKAGFARVKARHEAVLAMIAVASQAPSSAGRGNSSRRQSDKDQAAPNGPSNGAPVGKEGKSGKGVSNAQKAARQAKGQAASSPSAAAAGDAAGGAVRAGGSWGSRDAPGGLRVGSQPFLPKIAGKSDPSVRAEMFGWELEGQVMSLREAAQAVPPSFTRRISGPLLAAVEAAAADAAGALMSPSEGGALGGPILVDNPELQQVLNQGVARTTAAAAGGTGAGADAAAAAKKSLLSQEGGVGADSTTAAAAGAENGSLGTPRESSPEVSVFGGSGGGTEGPNGGPGLPTGVVRIPEGAEGVWRLTLSCTAPLKAYRIPYPEYQVAAGALLKQMQQLGVTSEKMGWGRSSRGSWPLVQMHKPTT